MATASARIRGKFSRDKLSLSKRFHKNDKATVDLMRRQVVGSVRAGESTTRIAERLLDVGDPIVRLPKHVTELEEAARHALASGDKNVYLKAVKKWEATIERLGATSPELSIRSATQELAKKLKDPKARSAEITKLKRELKRAQAAGDKGAFKQATARLVKETKAAKAKQIDDIVDRWTLERARHQARTIARSEVVEGYRDQTQRQAADQDYVVGIRWELSPRHSVVDVCDVLASQDVDGLGPGGYLPGNVPSTPHPSDLCSQSPIIDTDHFARLRAKRKGTKEPSKPWLSGKKQTGEQWLKTKPEAFQQRLLGPSRFEAFQKGKRVLDDTGNPIPVYKVLGTRKPVRRLGPARVAKPLIKRDRSEFVLPFPKVAPSRK